MWIWEHDIPLTSNRIGSLLKPLYWYVALHWNGSPLSSLWLKPSLFLMIEAVKFSILEDIIYTLFAGTDSSSPKRLREELDSDGSECSSSGKRKICSCFSKRPSRSSSYASKSASSSVNTLCTCVRRQSRELSPPALSSPASTNQPTEDPSDNLRWGSCVLESSVLNKELLLSCSL